MTPRDKWFPRLREVFGGRPVRWADNAIGDYDGRERTLEVFNVDGRDQLPLRMRLRPLREELENDLGGPVVIIFHTSNETTRLYGEVVAREADRQLLELAARLLAVLPNAHIERRTSGPNVHDLVVWLRDRRVVIECDGKVGYQISPAEERSDPELIFRIANVERASQSIALLVSELSESLSVFDPDQLPERNVSRVAGSAEDPPDLGVKDQLVETDGKHPPRNKAA